MSCAEPFAGAAALARAWSAGLAPDPALSVSDWADAHRVLSSRAASEAGPYRTARTPYMRAIMDALGPHHPAKRVVFMKSAQVGATEAGNNWLGYCIHMAPGPILAVQPTVDLAKRLSQQRIDPLIEESPVLRERVAPSRSRDAGNTVLAKRFPGGQMILTGANSAVGLRSMPARWVFLDEVDAYPGDVDGEGDPIALAEARTASFGHRAKLFLVSTPTIKGASRIEREWELTDQNRYHVPCPHCGGLQWLRFERLRWEKGRPETAVYICEHCEAAIEERHKPQMMAEENGARWLPTAAPDAVERARALGIVGFHISGLYSPLGWRSWADIARIWEEAQGNDAALKTAKNTVLGETWAERGEAPDWQRLYERREDWPLGTAPEGALVLTAGADVQRDRIEVDVWGWGRRLESWLVDHVVIEGDTGGAEVWQELTRFLDATWPHESGARMRLARLAIDAGDGLTTGAVYAWVRSVSPGPAMAVKGVPGFDRAAPVDGPSHADVTENGRRLRRGVRFWKVAGAVFKGELYRFLRQPVPTDEELAQGKGWPPGFVHLPRGVTAEWLRQLTAEQLVTVRTRTGFAKLEWQQIRERNEALDARVYARAAAWLIGIDRWDEARWVDLEAQLVEAGAREAQLAGDPSRRGRPSGRRPTGWFGDGRREWFR
ncbi:Phage terminase, large subunit GpA [Meinhardsimonia xiamenensis]|uniref:Phage terminase, large subunit GpA n=1 Tax=Meinhardsimonia xiamenensis TaxID=990712 RepID=A0A1G9HHU5_9RHOB|nr:phage terminase large subunit family protein [Meinhardsimonia xiamenensis]PRX27773.1 phage terminase large subunit GpA-like protein [Meinhardsimonia xiamenensis]SDL12581.1 Phage terminase, large subunit GpA [Meinhardsimonia xiamenensis]